MRLSGSKSDLLRLLREGVRDPYLTLRTSLRLALRGLDYLSENPDALVLPFLLRKDGDYGPDLNALLIIGRAKRISVAIRLRQSEDGRICVEAISRDLLTEPSDSSDRLDLPLMVERLEERYGLIDTAIFLSEPSVRRIKTMILSDDREDPLLVAAEGFLDEINQGGIEVWPRISILEVLSQIEPSELLRRFADRFGLYLEYRRNLRRAGRGLTILVRELPRLIRGSLSFPPLPTL